jgi:hypothetical protein
MVLRRASATAKRIIRRRDVVEFVFFGVWKMAILRVGRDQKDTAIAELPVVTFCKRMRSTADPLKSVAEISLTMREMEGLPPPRKTLKERMSEG